MSEQGRASFMELSSRRSYLIASKRFLSTKSYVILQNKFKSIVLQNILAFC